MAINTKVSEADAPVVDTVEAVVATVSESTVNRDPMKGKVIGSCVVEIRSKITDHILPLVSQGSQRIENDYPSHIQLGAALTAKGRNYGKVFDTLEEERKIMLALLDIEYDKATYTKAIKDYWEGFLLTVSQRVPVKLEVGFEADLDGELSPINPRDYTVFRMCLINANVANHVRDVNKSPNIKFYLHTDSQERVERLNAIKRSDLARKKREEIALDSARTKLVLLAGTNVVYTDPESAILALYDFATTEVDKFLEVVSSPTMEDEALINYLVGTNVIKRAANSTALFYDNTSIGSNIKEAVEWLRMPMNAQNASYLKGLMGTK